MYKIIKIYPKQIPKDGNFHTRYIFVENKSNFCWKDNTNISDPKYECKFIEPFIKDHLSKRYFEISLKSKDGDNQDIFYGSSTFKRPKTNNPIHRVEPGDKFFVKLNVKAKDYTPAGINNLLINLRENKSKNELKTSDDRAVKIKVAPEKEKDDRKLDLSTLGEVDSVYENKAFKSASDKIEHKHAVVMAVWKRIERLDQTFDSLILQKKTEPVLYLWVNNRNFDKEIKNKVASSKLPIKVYFSKSNVGGFGRFYLGKDIADTHKKVIFIDDDQVPASTAFTALHKEHTPNSIWGVYASQFPSKNDYWLRRELEPGEKADYIGTCGMILETKIFQDERLFNCPERYWFIEDLWLCWFAYKEHDWELYKSSANIKTVDDNKDQFRMMINLKNEFFKYLVKRGLRTHEDKNFMMNE